MKLDEMMDDYLEQERRIQMCDEVMAYVQGLRELVQKCKDRGQDYRDIEKAIELHKALATDIIIGN